MKMSGLFVISGVQYTGEMYSLFDLGFFVDHMLTRLGIELHDLHFVRHSALVFISGVEVTCTCSRFQLNFVAA